MADSCSGERARVGRRYPGAFVYPSEDCNPLASGGGPSRRRHSRFWQEESWGLRGHQKEISPKTTARCEELTTDGRGIGITSGAPGRGPPPKSRNPSDIE